jgi:hypothetical protein
MYWQNRHYNLDVYRYGAGTDNVTEIAVTSKKAG